MSNRSLVATINSREVGTLREENNIWSFQYASGWLESVDAFALSPHIPLGHAVQVDGATHRPVQWYFDNLLPEEAARELLAKDANVQNPDDAFALLAYYGAESAGSLTLKAPGSPRSGANHYVPLTDEQLEARINQLPDVPLTHGAPKRMSLAGAQHKLAIHLDNGALFEPVGATPSTHIAKPNHKATDLYPHSVINEWFTMRLAGQLGLDVPKVTRRYVPSPVYIVERFDREKTNAVWHRRHAIDGCQLLNLAPVFKYSSWDIDALARIAAYCRTPIAARLTLFKWLVFCVVVANADSHLKNLSVLIDAANTTMSPCYDLISIGVYDTRAFNQAGQWPDGTRFVAPIEGIERFSGISRALLLAAGQRLGLPESIASRELDSILDRTLPHADALIEQVAAENAAMLVQRPELAATFGGEMRCLRAIRYTVLMDMVKQLSAPR